MDAGAGFVRMDENRMRRRHLDAILTGNMARVALKMGVHRPTTPEEPAKNQKKNRKPRVCDGFIELREA